MSAQQDGQETEAVSRSVFWQLYLENISKGCEHICETYGLSCRGARLNFIGPSNDEGHAMPPFPRIALHSAQVASGTVPELVDILRIPDRTVVRSEQHQRVLRHGISLQRRQDLTDRIVDLHDKIAVQIDLAPTAELSLR